MTRLVILTLLNIKPMHGYEIRQFIKEQYMDQWAEIRPGSIYFALGQMEKESLVAAGPEERTGDRLRRKYAVTAKGQAALLDLVREALASPPHSLKSSFSFALSPALLLPAAERRELLSKNLKQLQALKEFWKTGRRIKAPWHPALKLAFDHDLEIIDSDIRLLRKLIELPDDPGAAALISNVRQSLASPRPRRKRT